MLFQSTIQATVFSPNDITFPKQNIYSHQRNKYGSYEGEEITRALLLSDFNEQSSWSVFVTSRTLTNGCPNGRFYLVFIVVRLLHISRQLSYYLFSFEAIPRGYYLSREANAHDRLEINFQELISKVSRLREINIVRWAIIPEHGEHTDIEEDIHAYGSNDDINRHSIIITFQAETTSFLLEGKTKQRGESKKRLFVHECQINSIIQEMKIEVGQYINKTMYRNQS